MFSSPPSPPAPSEEVDEWGKLHRRFQPKALPKGLLQACGHTQHKKMKQLFPKTTKDMIKSSGRIRSLWYEDRIRYEFGQKEIAPNRGVLWMVDGAMNHTPYKDVELLQFGGFLS